MKVSKLTDRNLSKGFSLVELLVVVAIIGALSAIGTIAYNGYVGGAKASAAKNSIQQISLMQQEYQSIYGSYHTQQSAGGCTVPASANTADINTTLFEADDGEEAVDVEDYEFCIEAHATGYKIVGCEIENSACKGTPFTLNAKGGKSDIF